MGAIDRTIQAEASRASIPVPAMPYRWTGEALEPLHPRRADQYLVVGEVYHMAPDEPRSQASHGHEFAWLHEAFKQLPEHLADTYPSEEHLRKAALIQGGFHHQTIFDLGTHKAALRAAPGFRFMDEYAYVAVRGQFVIVRRAESQSRKAMGGKRFQESKSAIMQIVSDLIAVEPAALVANAGAAA